MRQPLSDQQNATIYQYQLVKRKIIRPELIQSHLLIAAILLGFSNAYVPNGRLVRLVVRFRSRSNHSYRHLIADLYSCRRSSRPKMDLANYPAMDRLQAG